jgi:hypothetical protein
MSAKAVPHDLTDKPVYGTPRTVPFVLFCLATERFCGKTWIANTWEEYDQHEKTRAAHQVFCGTAQKHNLILPS